jgi:hypothetical protein
MATRGWSWLALVWTAAACSESEPSRPVRDAKPRDLPPIVEVEYVLLPNGNVVAASSPSGSSARSFSGGDSSLALFGLETRDHLVFLHSTESGRRYTVKTKDGRVLADRIDVEQLGRDYPDLLETIEGGVDLLSEGRMMGFGADD